MLLGAVLLGSLGAVELRWESVAGCPEAPAIARDLDALLGERPRAAAVAVTGRLQAARGADGYVLYLDVALADRREARELRANDCAVLARAGVLVAAVTADALATAAVVDASAAPAPGSSTPVPEPVASSPPSVAEEPVPPALPRPTTSASTSDRPSAPPLRGVTLAASAGVSWGMTPAVAGGIEGELGWRRGPLRLALAGFHWFSRSLELRPGVGIEAALSGGSLRGCLAFERARLEVPLCAALDLAAMHGGGTGSSVRRRDAADVWVGVAMGTGLSFWVTRRLALQARVEGVLGARRAAMYLVEDGEPQEVFRMPPVGVRLLAGPLVRLW